jgi:oxygen-independent coproporphyrinogen-3 oxidase
LASTRYFRQVVDAIVKEIALRKDFLNGAPVTTIYFGGGTPSLMQGAHLEKIMAACYTNFNVAANAEITLEANPDDLSQEKARMLASTNINRLSIGVQSFHDKELHFLNRVHTSQKAVQSIEEVQDAGFTNLTIDLIYGIPGSTAQSWRNNLATVALLQVPHLSCYALTVEPGTAFDRFIKSGRMQEPDERQFLEQFNILMEEATANGYEQYEISNFCTGEKYARHNTAYWFGEPYLGVGPSAHSYDGKKRTWNIAHLKKYIDGIDEGDPALESETLTTAQAYNEFVMTRLRTKWGVPADSLPRRYGPALTDHFHKVLQKYSGSDLITYSDNTVRLTRKGIMLADAIIADFFSG